MSFTQLDSFSPVYDVSSPWGICTGTCWTFSHLSFLSKLFLSRKLAEDTAIHAFKARSTDLDVGCENGNSPGTQCQPTSAMIQGQCCQPHLLKERVEIILNHREKVFIIKKLKVTGYHFYIILVTLLF